MIALVPLLLIIGAVALLRLLSHKCPNCNRPTIDRQGKAYHCENGHCDNIFTE